MIKNVGIFLLLCVLLSWISGCDYYVDIEPDDITRFQYIKDYRLLLNDVNTLTTAYGSLDLCTDDIDFSGNKAMEQGLPPSVVNQFTFQPFFYADNEDDNEWNALYKQIYIANVVIEGIMLTKDGTIRQKKELLGEALVHRAFAYWALVNIYAKPFNAQTAATDLGVPLLLKPDLHARLERVPVKEIYDRIINDLKLAISMLPPLPELKLNPAQAAAYAMLSRTYLMMSAFEEAGKYADSSLRISQEVIDLNDIKKDTPYLLPQGFNNPEIILLKHAHYEPFPLLLSKGLQSLLETTDLRYQLFTTDYIFSSGQIALMFYGNDVYLNRRDVGPRVPEMLLTRAETLARANKIAAAMEIVNDLRRKRFAPENYNPLNATTAKEAIKVVLEERRRELFGRGMRWFDLRRLNQEASLAKYIVHEFEGVKFMLEPGNARYVYPIPKNVILINPEIIQNPR